MKRSPYRADHAGSFLRPQKLSDSRKKWRDGKLSDQELKLVEDQHVQQIVSMQESMGLKGITDGEFRRDYWHLDFIAAFDGVELNNETYGHSFSGGGTVATFKVNERFGNNNGSMREHFRYLNSITNLTAKFCIPAPGMTYLRSGRAG
ncbi:MAG: 5-methyltetrahydropteroyltriglutamate--homocysteine S-methyltransferase, partial [Pseudomonadota bacterium]|nr:5-methyltetrahydropteroyltriglutamate--homocysteine S-methyltransferase [Pseudomonadota bacterium]